MQIIFDECLYDLGTKPPQFSVSSLSNPYFKIATQTQQRERERAKQTKNKKERKKERKILIMANSKITNSRRWQKDFVSYVFT